jgi:hypothetical protein
MSALRSQIIILSFVALLTAMPFLSYAEGLAQTAQCSGTDCQICHVVYLINGVIAWLVMILGTVAAIIIVYAGFKLVTSGGNRHAKEDAKELINNMLIGYVIVLAGWLLIDTGMKMLLVDGETKLGMWNELSCVDQPELVDQTYTPDEFNPWIGSFTEDSCDPDENGRNTNCTRKIQECNASGGTAQVIRLNANESQVKCTLALPTDGTGGGGTGGGGSGTCRVETNSNNACHPSKLTCFPDRNLASKICNVESRGGNTGIMSGTDLCQDGKSFSVGLWQINILANKHLIPGCNSNFFTSSNGGRSEGSCVKHVTNSKGVKYCQFRSCRITNVSVYNQCVYQAKQPANNTRAACSLMSSQGWSAWATSYNLCK